MCAGIFKGNFGNDTDKMQGETFETPIFTMKFLQNLLRSIGYSYLHTWQTGISFFTLHRKKKVKCKVYNIGYSQQHVSLLIHVKFWTFKIRNYLSLFLLRVAVIRFDLWSNWIKMVEEVFHSSFAHVSNSSPVYTLKLIWWSKKQASLPLN